MKEDRKNTYKMEKIRYVDLFIYFKREYVRFLVVQTHFLFALAGYKGLESKIVKSRMV